MHENLWVIQNASKSKDEKLTKTRMYDLLREDGYPGSYSGFTYLVRQIEDRQAEFFDGKYLFSTSDAELLVEDVVKGYKQLHKIERVFYDLKHLLDIRPVYHRLEDRIRAHVLLCWLAILIIRIIENETNKTWFQIKKVLTSLKVGILKSPGGEVWELNSLKKEF